MRFPIPEHYNDWADWGSALIRKLIASQRPVNAPLVLPVYTASTLPAANQDGMMVMLSGTTGTDIPVYSLATSWRRVDDATEV